MKNKFLTVSILLSLNVFWAIKDLTTYMLVGSVALVPTVMELKFLIEEIKHPKRQEEN
jgi:hypothetical protein